MSDAVEKVARTWASMDGKPYGEGYVEDAAFLLRRSGVGWLIEELEAQNMDALREAKGLAKALHRRFYQKQASQWKPLEDVAGIVSQIDNMTAGMADRIEELQAKLAKSLAFLEFLDENYRHAFGDTARAKIRELHAELKGQDDGQAPHAG